MSISQPQIKSWFPWLARIWAVSGVFLAWVLTVRSLGSSLGEGFCKVNQQFDCSTVMSSEYSSLFGISWSYYGLWFYFSVLAHSFFWKRIHKDLNSYHSILSLAVSFAVLLSIYLFFISKLVIGAMCPYCVMLYTVNLVMLIGSLFGATSLALHKFCALGLKELWLIACGQGQANSRVGSFFVVIVGIIFCFLPAIFVEPSAIEQPTVEAPKDSLFIDEGVMGDYHKGNPDALVRIVEFSDIQCPYCRWYSTRLDDLVADYGDRVHFVFKNYPLDKSCNTTLPNNIHASACDSAEFVRCAGEQGAFWRVLQDLYAMPILVKKGVSRSEVKAELIAYAKQSGLDATALEECIESDRQLQRVIADIQQGRSIKLSSTPTILLNGVAQKELDLEKLRVKIDELLSSQS